jgi:hypothetical protein
MMNFLSIEKLWTENEIRISIMKIRCCTSSLDNIVKFDINYNSYYKEDVNYYKCNSWLGKYMKSFLSE